MIVSLVEQNGRNINNDHDRDSDMFWTSQWCDDFFKTVNRSLPEGAPVSLATATPMEAEESPALEVFLQVQASDRKLQATGQTVVFPASLFT